MKLNNILRWPAGKLTPSPRSPGAISLPLLLVIYRNNRSLLDFPLLKFILIALVLLLPLSLLQAQGYSVRVTYNTYLRATNSLDARIVHTAPTGATMSVIDQQEDWLLIDWNGRQVWMAAWVPLTRIETAPATLTAMTDNCCFINRNCQTDQDWTDGYWAYQRNECPVQSQVNQQSPSANDNQQSASALDNCCFINRQCQTDQDWTDGFWAYQRNECPASAPAHAGSTHDVAIQGSPRFVSFVTDALDNLQAISSKWHNYIVSAAALIIETEGLPSTGAAATAQRIIKLGPYSIWHHERVVGDPIEGVQGVIVHEACHIHRHEAGIPYIFDPELGIDPLEEWACSQVQCEMGSELRGSWCTHQTIEEWLAWRALYRQE